MWVCKGEHNGKGLHLEGRVGACGERDEIGLLELLVQGACRTFGIRRVNQAPATNTCARACARACVTVCTYIPRVSHALAQLQKGQIRVAVLYYTVASTHIRLHSKPRRHHQGMDYTGHFRRVPHHCGASTKHSRVGRRLCCVHVRVFKICE